jgi:hypothetical protein
MTSKLRLFQRLSVLAVLLVGLAITLNDKTPNASATAAFCCSYCDQIDLEICIDKPEIAICQGCANCNPWC